jgi:hypothetical protein
MTTQNEILKKKYVNPIWLNIEKSILEVEEKSNIGKVERRQNLVVKKWDDEEETKENTLFNTIVGIYSSEEIDKLTEQFNVEEKEKHELIRKEEEQESELKRLETLFKTKLDIFNIPVIFNSENKEAKSAIRKSKSIVEATALAVMLMMKEMENKDNENL